jgi:hypothetical protein
MSVTNVVIFAAAAMISTGVSAQYEAFDGSGSAIMTVVSGKTCVGDDILRFGEIGTGSAGVFERVGSRAAEYKVGYGTILIRRDGDLHGHITSVSVPHRVLYMGTSKYRC